MSVQRFDLRTDISDLTRMVDHITTFLNENRESADFRLFCRGETVRVHLFILGATSVFSFISHSFRFKGLLSLTQSTQQRDQVWKWASVLLDPLQLWWATCTDSASPGTPQTTESSLPLPTYSSWISSKRKLLSNWRVMDTSQRQTAF